MTIHATRTVLLPLAVLLLLAILAMQVRTVHGDPPPPVYVDADSCSQLAPGGVSWHEFRIDDPVAGAYSNGLLTVDLDFQGTNGQAEFGWQTNVPIDAVYAAGGPGGNLYQYAPPETADDGLHTPYNGSGKRYHSLNTILFCATAPLQPTATPPPTPRPTSTATTRPPTLTPSPTATTRPGDTPAPTETTVPPTMGPRYFPLAFSFRQGGEEPNDDCGSAYWISSDNAHQFLPDDRDDWFTFVVKESAEVTVILDNFGPLAGQIAAYRGANCASSQLLGNNGNTASLKELALGEQPADRFFLYVSNDGAPNTTEPYTLMIFTKP